MRKIKSFGIVEAMVASLVIILLLTGAVAVSSALIKNSTLDASYQEAESIAEEVFSLIEASRAKGELSFFGNVSGDGIYPIECFDSDFIQNGSKNIECLNSGDYQALLPYNTLNSNKRFKPADFNPTGFVISDERNPNFPSGFFNLNVQVPDDPASYTCLSSGSDVVVPWQKCRLVDVTVSWQERGHLQKYYISQRFTSWQK